jgi:hypothetical protein
MGKKPSGGNVPMTAINADVPSETMDRVRIAKVLTKATINQIVAEALESWLRERGFTSDKMPKPKPAK